MHRFRSANTTKVHRKPATSLKKPPNARPIPDPILETAIRIANIDAAIRISVFPIEVAKKTVSK